MLTFTLPVIVAIISVNLLISRYISRYQVNLLRTELSGIASALSAMIESDRLPQQVPDGLWFSSDDCKWLGEKLNRIVTEIPSVSGIYILKNDKNNFYILSSAGTDNTNNSVKQPGSVYPSEKFPGIFVAFAAPLINRDIQKIDGNYLLTGYFPVRNAGGEVSAILKVDYSAADTIRINRVVHFQILMFTLIIIMLTVFFGFFVSHQISAPLWGLVEGVRNIQRGNLDYRVPVISNDEFGQLARAFNQMIVGLYTSRKMLQSYLYRTIRSFVTILEARDPYTKGHSERVAFFSEIIARKMRIPEKKITLLKEIALLHDIGKLAIEENILQKQDTLTEQEWNIIRRHPVAGEEMLRPVFFDRDCLEIVRQHHERFDGKGYPDGLTRDRINILAQILAVADAYDAITSARAYRPALSKKQAIEELKKNRGTQFNPDVVDVFLEVLEEEMHEIIS